MARKRNITADISTDPRVFKLSDFEALLYTWMIPAATDDCVVVKKTEDWSTTIRLRVFPGRNATDAEIEQAVNHMIQLGLLIDDGLNISFPPPAFYKHQHYIPLARRIAPDSAQNGADPRKSAQNPASPSPSPSPSLNPPLSPPKPRRNSQLLVNKELAKDSEKTLVKELRSETGPEPISDPLDRAIKELKVVKE